MFLNESLSGFLIPVRTPCFFADFLRKRLSEIKPTVVAMNDPTKKEPISILNIKLQLCSNRLELLRSKVFESGPP